jgi:hypothetical protein
MSSVVQTFPSRAKLAAAAFAAVLLLGASAQAADTSVHSGVSSSAQTCTSPNDTRAECAQDRALRSGESRNGNIGASTSTAEPQSYGATAAGPSPDPNYHTAAPTRVQPNGNCSVAGPDPALMNCSK